MLSYNNLIVSLETSLHFPVDAYIEYFYRHLIRFTFQEKLTIKVPFRNTITLEIELLKQQCDYSFLCLCFSPVTSHVVPLFYTISPSLSRPLSL